MALQALSDNTAGATTPQQQSPAGFAYMPMAGGVASNRFQTPLPAMPLCAAHQLLSATVPVSPAAVSFSGSQSPAAVRGGVHGSSDVVICAMCDVAPATLHCLHCREMYCNSCNLALHGQGRFKQHTVRRTYFYNVYLCPY